MAVKVLIVDDSLFMRRLVSDIFESDPDTEVIGTARSGEEMRKVLRKTGPDCITLDLALPDEDGLSLLRYIMAEYPTPVVILSAHSKKNADITKKCLDAGAEAVVFKPSGEVSLDIERIRDQLIREVILATRLGVRKLQPQAKPEKPTRESPSPRNAIVIGASTGGPQALRVILASLPGDLAGPVIVVQHMPSMFFTEGLAGSLDRSCELAVRVAENREVVRAGRVYLAPGGWHIVLRPRKDRRPAGWTSGRPRSADVILRLRKAKPDELSPSIDLAMKSVARTYGRKAVGVILSGLGHDGRDGMKAIKAAGGLTIAQDESSLIFGMPKAVIEAGYADKVSPSEKIPQALIDAIQSRRETNRGRTRCAVRG